jgi:hypothetical protein
MGRGLGPVHMRLGGEPVTPYPYIEHFCASVHCTSRIHCRTCRRDPAWRAAVGAPAVCPEGFAPESFPLAQASPRRESIGEAVKRLQNCEPCKKKAEARNAL